MMKENGRLRPKENQEVSSQQAKQFVCPKCGKTYSIKSPEFGTTYYCEVCDNNTPLKEK